MPGNSSGASIFAKHPTIAGLYVGVTDSTDTSVTDPAILVIFKSVSPDTTANTYAHGCIGIVTSDSSGASIYQNTGTLASPAWTLMDISTGSLSLPASAADTTTTTGTSLGLTANSITTGTGESFTATGLTTGAIYKAVAAAATLTTGAYFVANDGATNVFHVGKNGHTVYTQTTAPTIVVTQQNGITASAIVAGSTDNNGSITTTGTNNNGGDTILTVTFNKAFTATPKAVVLTAANASGAGPNPPYISTVTAGGFAITIPASGTAGATPSWYYHVIG